MPYCMAGGSRSDTALRRCVFHTPTCVAPSRTSVKLCASEWVQSGGAWGVAVLNRVRPPKVPPPLSRGSPQLAPPPPATLRFKCLGQDYTATPPPPPERGEGGDQHIEPREVLVACLGYTRVPPPSPALRTLRSKHTGLPCPTASQQGTGHFEADVCQGIRTAPAQVFEKSPTASASPLAPLPLTPVSKGSIPPSSPHKPPACGRHTTNTLPPGGRAPHTPCGGALHGRAHARPNRVPGHCRRLTHRGRPYQVCAGRASVPESRPALTLPLRGLTS